MDKHKKSNLPESFRQYFWDVDFEDVDKNKSKIMVIKRVLDRGTTKDVKYLFDTYNKKEIEEVVLSTRDLARPTGNFWADILGLDKNKLPCLQKPYDPIHWGIFS